MNPRLSSQPSWRHRWPTCGWRRLEAAACWSRTATLKRRRLRDPLSRVGAVYVSEWRRAVWNASITAADGEGGNLVICDINSRAGYSKWIDVQVHQAGRKAVRVQADGRPLRPCPAWLSALCWASAEVWWADREWRPAVRGRRNISPVWKCRRLDRFNLRAIHLPPPAPSVNRTASRCFFFFFFFFPPQSISTIV